MSLGRPSRYFILYRAALSLAAWMVPANQRREWLQEWNAELWHGFSARQNTWWNQLEEAKFCRGAFWDALCFTRNTTPSSSPTPTPPFLSSPLHCLMLLAALAAASALLVLCLPDARDAMLASIHNGSGDVVVISREGGSRSPLPNVRVDQYRDWKTQAPHWKETHLHVFSDLAFYHPTTKLVHISKHNAVQLTIAQSTQNLFQVANVPVSLATSDFARQDALRGLVLSEASWRTYFHADPRIAGRTLQVGNKNATILGVVLGHGLGIPGQQDGWLLEDDRHMEHLPHSQGFVIGRLSPQVLQVSLSGRLHMSAPNSYGARENFDCISLAEVLQEPRSFFLFALFLACLALPATTPLPLGEYPRGNHPPGWSLRLRRWVFLAAKLVLILFIVYPSGVALAHLNRSILPAASECIQLLSSFCGCLFAFRWALRDQRKRCPTCLEILRNPARVGQPSRNFLDWNGTELICAGGHGLLHVPELPMSWFSTQRWLYLDASWACLFSRADLASTGLP